VHADTRGRRLETWEDVSVVDRLVIDLDRGA
jgi:hypothetical protein